MRISDWSSDVCSSDLHARRLGLPHRAADAGVPAARPQGRGGRLMFVDSHCHLNYKGLVEEQQAVLERARARGVERMLHISNRESEWDDVSAPAARAPAVSAPGIGSAPCRDREGQNVRVSVVAVSYKKK